MAVGPDWGTGTCDRRAGSRCRDTSRDHDRDGARIVASSPGPRVALGAAHVPTNPAARCEVPDSAAGERWSACVLRPARTPAARSARRAPQIPISGCDRRVHLRGMRPAQALPRVHQLYGPRNRQGQRTILRCGWCAARSVPRRRSPDLPLQQPWTPSRAACAVRCPARLQPAQDHQIRVSPDRSPRRGKRS